MATVVLMSAIVPTQGHLDLLNFALKFNKAISGPFQKNPLRVLVGFRDGEPTPVEDRISALKRDMDPNSVVHFGKVNESGVEDLIGLYNQLINDHDYLVSSEEYAKELNGISIPYDIDRWNDPTQGTNVRNHLFSEFSRVIPSFRQHVSLRATLFGPESVGKTTTTASLARNPFFSGRAEFARPYLEHKEDQGYDLTDMLRIWKAQYALQSMPLKTPILIQDTDLYCTLGYYRIMGEQEPTWAPEEAERYKSDLYVILDPAGAPFTPDPLRYGGDHRESQLDFWVSLAEEFDLNYVVMTATEACDETFYLKKWEEKTRNIRDYVRPDN